MLKLRLKKFGRKGKPSYRIVTTDSRVKRDGKVIEELGFYNPFTKETHLKIKQIQDRIRTGAQPTDTVLDILKKANVV
jgi:small subunit ribosomal protein S16